MAKKTYYWLGYGVVLIDGKKYKTGQKIPAGKVDPDRLESWEKAGKVGTSLFTADDGEALTAYQEMEAKAKEANAKVAGLNAKISDLEKQVEELTDPKKSDKDKK